MALLPFYDVGLATFNATDVVTFSGGASMAAAAAQPYDRIENRLGQGFAIKEILSDTSVRLTRAHTGTAQTNQPYAIWPTPSPTELIGKARNALAIAGSPFIGALAGLNGIGGNKLGWITGEGTMDVTAFTLQARQLLDDGSFAAMRTTLGVGEAPTYGTWTPRFIASTADPTITYTNQTGLWVKIGRLIGLSFRMDGTQTVAGTGTLGIGGVPFANSGNWSGSVGISTFTTANVASLDFTGSAAVSLRFIASDNTVYNAANVRTGIASVIVGSLFHMTP